MAFDFREEALRGLVAFREALDHLIGESLTRHAGGHATEPGSFSVDVFEQDAHYILQASLPGVKPEDLVIQAQGNLIAIRGERLLLGEQTDQQWILREHHPVRFSRSITLPCAIDAVAASALLEYGLLTLKLPKAETIKIIPLSTPAETSALTATADVDSEHANLESSSALPTDNKSAVVTDAIATIPDLEALMPASADVAEVVIPIAAPDADVTPTLTNDSASENEVLSIMATVSADESPAADIAAAEVAAIEEALVAAIVAAAIAEEANEEATVAVLAIQEAEAIVEAVQEAALVAELADIAGDAPMIGPTSDMLVALAAAEEVLIAEEIFVAELAEAAVVADEAAIVAVELAKAAIIEAATEPDATLAVVAVLGEAEAEEIESGEGVVATVPEMTPTALADVANSDAAVAAAAALTEATIIAEELVEEILHEVEDEIVREIIAEMAEAQREAVADVIAEALMADVLSADAPTNAPHADAISANADEAAPVEVAITLEEVH